MDIDDPLRAVVARLREGGLRAEDLFEQARLRYEASEAALGAYRTWAADRAQSEARAADRLFSLGIDLGPLQGVPVSVKDLYGVRGLPTYAGSPRELPESWRGEGAVVGALRREMAVLTGKTHTVEFAFGGVGTNGHCGTPRNPWDAGAHRVAGGSSSGAAVSLCQGSAMLALGSDTAGSVRVPASWTGNAGIKTSKGRWPTDGIVPLSPLLDTAGLLARRVDDLALAVVALEAHLPVGQGEDRPPPAVEIGGLRIGLSDGVLWQDCAPGIAETVRAALDELARKGARLRPLAFPEATDALEVFHRGGTAATELYAFLRDELPDWLETLDPIVASRVVSGHKLSAADFLSRGRRLDRLAKAAAERFGEVDVIASPTIPIPPPTVEEVAAAGVYHARNIACLRNTSIANYLGLCALTLPVGLDALGLPVGLQLVARHGDDRRLLAIGCAVESILGDGRQRLGTPPMLSGS